MAQDNEAFLSRWSRRKLEADKEEKSAPPDERKRSRDEKPVEPPPGEQARAAQKPAGAVAPAGELPPLDKLTSESDFGDFMKPGVDDNLRRSALKKLFADPRFNVIDAMDIDIDDYTNMEKLPPEMLKNLAHVRRTLFGLEDDKKKESGELAQDKAPERAPQELADARDAAGPEAQDGREAQDQEPAQQAQRAQAENEPQARVDPDAAAKKG